MKIIKDISKIDEHNNYILFDSLQSNNFYEINIKNKLHYRIQNLACLKEKHGDFSYLFLKTNRKLIHNFFNIFSLKKFILNQLYIGGI